MGKLITLAVVAGVAYYGYTNFFAKSEAFDAYQKYATAMSKGDCGQLQSMAEGPAKEKVDGFCTGGSMKVYGKDYKTPAAATVAQDLASTPAGVMSSFRYSLESETASGSEVNLKVKQSVVGRPSKLNPLRGPVVHLVKMTKASGAWKVLEFEEQK
ncbi:MAG: hypothetical protein HY078_04050 [Elusimicrobia bacterium]|nr:hypothetical protein [Elusimicrobiota bacterium]